MITRLLRTACLVIVVTVSVVAGRDGDVLAQGRRGGGRMGGGGGFASPNRLALLTQTLRLDPAQTKASKAILDLAHKQAADARTQLTAAHAAIGAAIQARKGEAEIAAAVQAYAGRAAAMAELEIKALAEVMKPLPDAMRQDSTRIDAALVLMHAAFVGKKWDEQPGLRTY